jgi:hypothetical protein
MNNKYKFLVEYSVNYRNLDLLSFDSLESEVMTIYIGSWLELIEKIKQVNDCPVDLCVLNKMCNSEAENSLKLDNIDCCEFSVCHEEFFGRYSTEYLLKVKKVIV